jgi:glycosyltransferase involved in cell wall biosynthesis
VTSAARFRRRSAIQQADYVGRALASISSQTFAGFEVIVFDDGSADSGREIVTRHADPRVRALCQQNRGPRGARDRGIRLSHGALLAFLDAHDKWLPHYLEALTPETKPRRRDVGEKSRPEGSSRRRVPLRLPLLRRRAGGAGNVRRDAPPSCGVPVDLHDDRACGEGSQARRVLREKLSLCGGLQQALAT